MTDSKQSRMESAANLISNKIGASVEYLPDLLAAVLILVLGWLVARFVRGAVRRIAAASNNLLDNAFPSGMLAEVRVSPVAAAFLGQVAFWVILLIAATLASGIAGTSGLSVWLDRITAHLPHLVAGVAIVIVGYLLGLYVRELIAPEETSTSRGQRAYLARAMQGLTVAVSLIIGLDHIGVEVNLLVMLTAISVGALLAGFVAAFALGARDHVSNLIGIKSARRHIDAGVRIRVNDVEGEILEIATTQIVLHTDQGKALLPGKFLDSHVTTIFAPEEDNDEKIEG